MSCFVTAPSSRIADAAAELVLDFELAQGTLESRPPQVRVRERELHGIDPAEPVVTDAAEQSLLRQVRGRSSWPS